MGTALRVCATAIAAVSTYFFVYWLPGSLLLRDAPEPIRVAIPLTCAIIAAIVVWRTMSTKPRRPLAFIVLGAILGGSIGFAGGFFRPIIFAPDANQGPLLGLFITGPLGVLAGAIGGGIYWSISKARKLDEDARYR